MINKYSILKVYEDNGFVLHLVGVHYHISNPEWNIEDNKNKDKIERIQRLLIGVKRTLNLTIEEMLILLLKHKLISVED